MRSKRAFALVLALLVTSGVAAACGDDDSTTTQAPGATAAPGAWEPEFVDGVLQPLPDGFPSETIQLLVVDDAASDDGIYARQFQEVAQNMSPVNIQVVDKPELGGYGTWEGLNWAQGEPGGAEGHVMIVVTVPGSTADLITTPVAQDLGVSMESLNFVMMTEAVPYLVLGRTGAPWGESFQEFVDYAAANSGEIRYISRGPGAGLNVAFQTYMQAGGFDVETVIGGSLEEINLVVGAGEGDVAVNIPGVSRPFIEDGRLVALACTGDSPCEVAGKTIPNAGSVLNIPLDPWGSNRGMVVHPDAPDLHREWLEVLMREVIKDAGFQEGRKRVPALNLVEYDNAKALELQIVAYNQGWDILSSVGLLDPSVTEKDPAAGG